MEEGGKGRESGDKMTVIEVILIARALGGMWEKFNKKSSDEKAVKRKIEEFEHQNLTATWPLIGTPRNYRTAYEGRIANREDAIRPLNIIIGPPVSHGKARWLTPMWGEIERFLLTYFKEKEGDGKKTSPAYVLTGICKEHPGWETGFGLVDLIRGYTPDIPTYMFIPYARNNGLGIGIRTAMWGFCDVIKDSASFGEDDLRKVELAYLRKEAMEATANIGPDDPMYEKLVCERIRNNIQHFRVLDEGAKYGLSEAHVSSYNEISASDRNYSANEMSYFMAKPIQMLLACEIDLYLIARYGMRAILPQILSRETDMRELSQCVTYLRQYCNAIALMRETGHLSWSMEEVESFISKIQKLGYAEMAKTIETSNAKFLAFYEGDLKQLSESARHVGLKGKSNVDLVKKAFKGLTPDDRFYLSGHAPGELESGLCRSFKVGKVDGRVWAVIGKKSDFRWGMLITEYGLICKDLEKNSCVRLKWNEIGSCAMLNGTSMMINDIVIKDIFGYKCTNERTNSLLCCGLLALADHFGDGGRHGRHLRILRNHNLSFDHVGGGVDIMSFEDSGCVKGKVCAGRVTVGDKVKILGMGIQSVATIMILTVSDKIVPSAGTGECVKCYLNGMELNAGNLQIGQLAVTMNYDCVVSIESIEGDSSDDSPQCTGKVRLGRVKDGMQMELNGNGVSQVTRVAFLHAGKKPIKSAGAGHLVTFKLLNVRREKLKVGQELQV